MTKKQIIIIPVFVFFVLIQIANSQNSIVLSGLVLNGTQDSTAAANVTVELQQLKNSGRLPSILQTTQSNHEGRFSFSIAEVDTSITFVFGANHLSVHYFSKTFKLSDAVKPNLFIYDTTRSSLGVSAFMHHFFLQDDGRAISVRETIVLTNPSNKTIVGAIHEHGIGDAVAKFQLPVGAQNFTPTESKTGIELQKSGDFVYDTGVFIPGNRQTSYVYQLPWRRDAIDAYLKVSYSANSFDVFLNNPNLRITSQQLVDYGPFNIRGIPYRRLGTMNVAANTQIELRLEREASIEQNPIPVILITSLLLGLALVYGLASKSTSSKTKTVNNRIDLERDKAALIDKIALLDDKFAANPSASLKDQRATLFERLKKVAYELSKTPDNPRKKK